MGPNICRLPVGCVSRSSFVLYFPVWYHRLAGLEPLDADAVEAAADQAQPPPAETDGDGEGGTQVQEEVDAAGNNSLTRGRGPIPTKVKVKYEGVLYNTASEWSLPSLHDTFDPLSLRGSKVS